MKLPQLLKTLLDFSDHISKNSHINSSLVNKTGSFHLGHVNVIISTTSEWVETLHKNLYTYLLLSTCFYLIFNDTTVLYESEIFDYTLP